MKKRVNWKSVLLASAISVLFLVISCDDPVTEPPADSDPPVDEQPDPDSESADRFLEALVLNNANTIDGTIPNAPVNASIKMNIKDTIYLMEGVKMPVRISHPDGQTITGVYVAVRNSTFFYDVPVQHVEDSDTVSIIFIDVDPDAFETDTSVPAKIVPHDENAQPLDEIVRVLTAEKPAGSGCDILTEKPGTLSDTSGFWSPEWFWHHTISFDPSGQPTFVNAPGNAHITETAYEGCCDFDENKNCNIISTELNSTVNVNIAYTIVSETFSFFTDETFVRQTLERKTNFDPETTEWCQGLPGYSHDNILITYRGFHDYKPGASSFSMGATWSSGCDLCGYGSPGGSLKYSCHMMVITRNNGMMVRTYVRSPTSDWYN